MKKIMTLLVLAFSLVLLAGCTDKKYYDTTVNVMFFTANRNASLVETYFNVEPGSKIEEPEEPTNLGHYFDGWFKDIERTVPWKFEEDVVGEKPIILYAKWLPGENDIIYELYGGEMPEVYPITYVTGKTVILVSPLSRVGYTFRGWFLYPWEDESSTKPGDRPLVQIPNNVAGDLTLHAHWERTSSVITFRINYPDPNVRPDGPDSVKMRYGDLYELPILDDTAEYRFIGWNRRADGTGTWVNTGDEYTRTQNTVLYAQWEKK